MLNINCHWQCLLYISVIITERILYCIQSVEQVSWQLCQFLQFWLNVRTVSYKIVAISSYILFNLFCCVIDNSVVSANDYVHTSLKELLFIVVLFKIPVTELVYGWCITIESVSWRQIQLLHTMSYSMWCGVFSITLLQIW